MTFVGIVTDCKSFGHIKKYIQNRGINLIHINKKSISNIKNIKLETVIINCDLQNFKNELKTLEQICLNAKYIVINADINLKFNLCNKVKNTIVTFGLNQKSTVTVSSITESKILIYLQRNIKNINEKEIEVGEKLINICENCKLKIYEIFILYIIDLIYNNSIIQQI